MIWEERFKTVRGEFNDKRLLQAFAILVYGPRLGMLPVLHLQWVQPDHVCEVWASTLLRRLEE